MVTMLVAGPVVAPAIGACAVIEVMTGLGVGASVAVIQSTVAGAAVAAAGTAATGATSAAIASAATVGAATGAIGSVAAAGGLMFGTFWAASVGADGYTWDCWKPVVLDESTTPSRGMAFRDLYHHPNIRRITANRNDFDAENIRGEHFRISPVDVDGALAFHATLA